MKWTNTANLIPTEFDETLSYDETLGGTNLYTNGNFEFGNTFNFGKTLESANPRSGNYYITQDNYSGWQSSEYVPVDVAKEYEISVWVRTITRSAQGSLAGGHLGFACYDKNKSFIDLRNCGDIGNTVLSRDLNPGDSYAYFESASGWYQGEFETVAAQRGYRRQILFFPASHPDYGTPWYYTRFNDMAYQEMIQMPEGDWRLQLANYTGSRTFDNSPRTMRDYGYALPAGTPVSRGQAGGTYNYAFSNPNYPEEWTNYQRTIPANDERRNSSIYFRQGTKYIRFLILGNYNIRSQSAPLAKFALDDIALVCVSDFQGNISSETVKVKQSADNTVYAQEFVEGSAKDPKQLGTISNDGMLTINNEIIEE